MRLTIPAFSAVLFVMAATGAATVSGWCGQRAAADESCGGQPCTWHFLQANVPSAQEPGRSGAGTTIAVVDSWIDQTHPDLRGRVVGQANCVGGAGHCEPSAPQPDGCVRGTHVAGTVASARYGVAPQASVIAITALAETDGGGCTGAPQDVAAGIRYAVANGADVITVSASSATPGAFQSDDLAEAVDEAVRAGAVVVQAAGARGIPVTTTNQGALLVGATGPAEDMATYSPRGDAIDLAAPGGDTRSAGLAECTESRCVLSTAPGTRHRLLEGTAMASAHVSGTAALLISQDRGRGGADVVRTLRITARPLTGTRHGLLDAGAALGTRATVDDATGSVGGSAQTGVPGADQGSAPRSDSRAGRDAPAPYALRAPRPAPRSAENAPEHAADPPVQDQGRADGLGEPPFAIPPADEQQGSASPRDFLRPVVFTLAAVLGAIAVSAGVRGLAPARRGEEDDDLM